MASQTHPRSRLYALLVAINNYKPPVPALRGCINDLQKVASYLEKESRDFEVHVHKLIDSEATKDNIVKAFTTHFEAANSDDVVLFYFSGHGTQEEADPVFWPVEEDHKLESLVCYDSYTLSPEQATFRLLADKELRFMISNLAKNGAHILMIFDCCHSGGNTKNGFVGGDDVRERRFICRDRLSQAFPVRAWKDFIFSESVSLDEVRNSSITQYLTEGKHIQLAACQHDESAFEVGGEGIFTKNLLEILTRCEGSVTYYDLQSRIQNYIRYQFKQTPKAYVSGDDESSLFLGFLNRKGEGKPSYGNINFNQSEGWVIDLGSMHGLSPESSIKVIINDSNESFIAKVKDVFPTHAILLIDKKDEDVLDDRFSYKGYSSDYFLLTLKVYINVQDPALKQELNNAFISSSDKNIAITELDREADYCIENTDDEIFISRPQMPSTPIILPVSYPSGNSIDIIKNYLQHLTQFEFVRRLENPNSFLFSKYPVEIVFYQKNTMQRDEEIVIRGGEIVPKFVRYDNGELEGGIRIKLKNISDRKLYCSLLYLSFNFGIYVKLLGDVVTSLAPNDEAWAMDGAYVPLKLEEEILRYNYKESVSTLKLMVSTSDFNQQALRFELPALPGPLSSGQKGLQMGLDISTKGSNEVQDWITRNIDVKIKNPDYKP
jgi:Caspase domain